MRINEDRLWRSLLDTAQIGGTAAGGIHRLALSDEDRRIRDWFAGECRALGCTLRVDEIGNMFALRAGTQAGAAPIAIGSHLDTQPTGGKFDGALGVLAGLEVLRTLDEAELTTTRPLLLVNWCNEEGARFAPAMLGSGVHAGIFEPEFALQREDETGVRFGEALDAIGYRGTEPAGSMAMAAMFELHIEQGPILEAEGIAIGIVEGVQAMRWLEVTFLGTEGHSGTTPMHIRDDALLAASRLVLGVPEIAARHAPGVGTVGFVKVTPNSRNVIPGSVSITVDLRHPDDSRLDEMEAALRQAVAEIDSTGRASVVEVWRNAAVRFDADCLAAVAMAVEQVGCSARPIVSGAGHDAAHVASVVPTAMIFVPCKDGLSHNEAEFASKADCATGAQVLLNAVLNFDRAPGASGEDRAS